MKMAIVSFESADIENHCGVLANLDVKKTDRVQAGQKFTLGAKVEKRIRLSKLSKLSKGFLSFAF